MPELPEVETIARELNRRLAGQELGRVFLSRSDIVHGDPRPLAVLLPGRRVEGVRRRAKRVITELGPQLPRKGDGKAAGGRRIDVACPGRTQLIFHLGMSGRLTVVPSQQPIEPHTHLRIAIPGKDCELRFRDPRRFGGVWCFAGSGSGSSAGPPLTKGGDGGGGRYVGKRLGEVGPEPLETTLAVFCRLLERPRQIKALLLDQRVLAGLGNIYCDEAIHAAGIHPLTRADVLDADQVRGLLRAIKSTLKKAIRFNGSTLTDYRTADGSEGSFQKHHRVYQREGKPCRKCGTPIVRVIAAGRSTFLCPTCQPRRKTSKSQKVKTSK